MNIQVNKSDIEISLIICTRNREHILRNHLESIEKIDATAPFEIIFVDNASADNTLGLLNRFKAASDINIQIISEARPGLSKARNRGISISRGNIIAFTDDDCYPNPDFIEQIYNLFKSNPDLGFLGGRVLLHDRLDKNIAIQTHDKCIVIKPGSFIETGLIHGANFSFRKEALDAAGNFDELLGIGGMFPSAEDVDMLTRISNLGWHGIYDPGPTVRHHHRRKTKEDYWPVKKRNDRGRGAYFAKCLLVSSLRKPCIYHWAGRLRHRPWKEVVYEICCAIEYLFMIKVIRIKS